MQIIIIIDKIVGLCVRKFAEFYKEIFSCNDYVMKSVVLSQYLSVFVVYMLYLECGVCVLCEVFMCVFYLYRYSP